MAMLHSQYWAARPPTSLFEQTLYEVDQLFYATFPAARHATCTIIPEQDLYDPRDSAYHSTLYDDVQSPTFEIHHEEMLDISSTSSQAGGSPSNQQLSYPYLADSRMILHSQRSNSWHDQDQLSYHYPLRVEDDAAVYISSEQSYHHRYSSEPMSSSPTTQSSPGSSVSAREPNPFVVYQPPNTRNSLNNNTDSQSQKTIGNSHSPESPRQNFRQLNRHMKPATLKFTNNCQLAVMRLERFSGHNRPSKRDGQSSSASPSKTLHVPSCQMTPTPTEFLLSSPKSPSIGLSSLPSKNLPERKPPLACLFCRGRKIACGPPLPGSTKKTCNQCRKRSLQCHYPLESRRGMRKKKPLNSTDATIKQEKLIN